MPGEQHSCSLPSPSAVPQERKDFGRKADKSEMEMNHKLLPPSHVAVCSGICVRLGDAVGKSPSVYTHVHVLLSHMALCINGIDNLFADFCA